MWLYTNLKFTIGKLMSSLMVKYRPSRINSKSRSLHEEDQAIFVASSLKLNEIDEISIVTTL